MNNFYINRTRVFITENFYVYYFTILRAFLKKKKKKLDSLREILNRGEEENSFYDSNLLFQQTWIFVLHTHIVAPYCSRLITPTIVVLFEKLKILREIIRLISKQTLFSKER